eukprot:TRINITY_DN49228_c0_g1_i1.p1 TRINITY_DN49228_c0_g1~~TRINITY_DN49228_c0_g1_i1.p1  ORF type:complete len:427 (+),score=83.37 TRINITY_DN49228_c0_g1_i1:46-1281(+)
MAKAPASRPRLPARLRRSGRLAVQALAALSMAGTCFAVSTARTLHSSYLQARCGANRLSAAVGWRRGRAQNGSHRRTRTARAAGGGEQSAAFALAALSSFFNGSFPACSRIPKGPELDPVLFNGLVCAGVFLSSLLVPSAFSVPWVFTTGGALGGALFVFAALFSFIAIPRAGLATAQAVWSCSAIVVSFAWGALGPSEVAAPLADATGSAVALALLIAGALVIVNCQAIAESLFGGADEGATTEGSTAGEGPSDGDRAAGIASALAVGLFGGSVLVPFKFIPPEAAGLAAVPSFGLGALLAGLAVTGIYWKGVQKEEGLPQVESDQLLAGLLSGILWNAGNVCSIIAQSPPFSLPYGIAYPILQCALFFGGLWGIYAFKEIQGSAVGTFWAGATTLAGGIVLLSLYGPGA